VDNFWTKFNQFSRQSVHSQTILFDKVDFVRQNINNLP